MFSISIIINQIDKGKLSCEVHNFGDKASRTEVVVGETLQDVIQATITPVLEKIITKVAGPIDRIIEIKGKDTAPTGFEGGRL